MVGEQTSHRRSTCWVYQFDDTVLKSKTIPQEEKPMMEENRKALQDKKKKKSNSIRQYRCNTSRSVDQAPTPKKKQNRDSSKENKNP